MSYRERIDGISFPSAGETAGLTVIRVKPDAVSRFAPRILDVMLKTYTRTFTVPSGTDAPPLLSPEAVDRHFSRRSPKNRERQEKRMTASIADGSAYWVARPSVYSVINALTGFIKVSPPEYGRRRWFRRPSEPVCIVRDLAANDNGMTARTALLYTALLEIDGNAPVALDAQDGNDAENEWLKSIGFRDDGPAPPLEIGGESLRQRRYVADENIAVSGLRAALMRRSPWLADNVPHVSW